MKNIVFLDEYSLNDADLSAIRRLGNYTGYPSTEPEQIIERAANAEIVIVNKVKLTAEIIGSLPKLELICEAATGVDNIDVAAAEARGIPVRNAKGYSTHSVAEATLGGAIAMLREVTYYDRLVKSGDYSTAPPTGSTAADGASSAWAPSAMPLPDWPRHSAARWPTTP